MEAYSVKGAKWVVIPALIIAAWVVLSRCILSWPLDVHLRDDAYYYFCWARSMANGDGPCVTPGVATSGVQILWALLLSGVAFVCGSAVLPAASVFLGMALHLGTAVMVYRAARPQHTIGLLAACAYAGAPFLATEAMNGQETALACFALALFLLVHHKGPRAFLWAGFFVVAARADLILLVAVVALVEPRARAARIVLTALIFAMYAGVNLLVAGHWMQDSAEPIPWLIEQEFDTTFGARMELLWQHTWAILLGSPFRLSSTPMAMAWFLVAWFGIRRRESRFAWLLLGALSLVCLHYYWRCYPRDYYFVPFGIAMVLATLRLCQLVPRLGFALLVLAVVGNGYRFFRYPVRTFQWQREMTMAGQFINEFIPADEPIGCFNSGIVMWHRESHVINLDGVVNRPAFEALKRGELLAYLKKQNVRYLVDNPAQFEQAGVHANGRHFGESFDASTDLEEVVRFTWPGDKKPRGRAGMEHFSLYRIRAEGRAPFFPHDGFLEDARDLGDAPKGRYVQWAGMVNVELKVNGVVVLTFEKEIIHVIQIPFSKWYRDGESVTVSAGQWGNESVLIIAPK